MASQAVHGRYGQVYHEDTPIAEISAFTISETADTAEATSMGDSAATYRLGVSRGDGTITAFWDSSNVGGQQLLVVGECTTLKLYPAGKLGGDLGCVDGLSGVTEIEAKCWITGKSMNVAMGDIISADYTFSLEGPLVETFTPAA